ncbi:MAG: DUF177 domain-containing protein [Pseudomonadota bacterium]|nr:DUF177 domain-containing protein [Pseudomonadota bacterium]
MAKSSTHSPQRLDVATFAAEGGTLEGEWRLSSLRRLVEAQHNQAEGSVDSAVHWQARGSLEPLAGAGVRPALRLIADTTVGVECQRCLQPMNLNLHAERKLFFVDGEDAAAALDLEAEDDVLALAPAVDLRALIEDELLLAMPIVPRHPACPEPLRAPADAIDLSAEPENPFAVLATLKGKRRPD